MSSLSCPERSRIGGEPPWIPNLKVALGGPDPDSGPIAICVDDPGLRSTLIVSARRMGQSVLVLMDTNEVIEFVTHSFGKDRPQVIISDNLSLIESIAMISFDPFPAIPTCAIVEDEIDGALNAYMKGAWMIMKRPTPATYSMDSPPFDLD